MVFFVAFFFFIFSFHSELTVSLAKIIAAQWRGESDAERLQWQSLSAKVKAEHANRYPEYQYSPRRREEIQSRRPRARVNVEALEFLKTKRRGQQRIRDAETGRGPNPWDFGGFVDVDEEFLDMLDDHSLLRGPHGVYPDLTFSCSPGEFNAMLQEHPVEEDTSASSQQADQHEPQSAPSTWEM